MNLSVSVNLISDKNAINIINICINWIYIKNIYVSYKYMKEIGYCNHTRMHDPDMISYFSIVREGIVEDNVCVF